MGIRRRSTRTVGALLCAVLALLFLGALYEPLAKRRDRTRIPQIGRSFDIGERSLNLHCVGEGEPTVIFDTFSHASGYSWIAVQREVGRFTRACWYDRAGYGWSDQGPLGQTAQMVASDLHDLVEAASIPRPFVLVGNGDASLQARVYAGLYPEELAGGVLINGNDVEDPPTPSDHLPPLARYLGRAAPLVRSAYCAAIPVMSRTGMLRLRGQPRSSGGGYGLSDEEEMLAARLSDNPVAYAATASSLCVQETSRAQAAAVTSLGDRPLVVVAFPDSWDSESNDYWMNRVQPGIASLSRRGRVQPLPSSDEALLFSTIVESVREVVNGHEGS